MTHGEWAEQLEALLARGLNEPLASHLPPVPDAFAAAAWAAAAFGPLRSGSVGDALELVRALDERLDRLRASIVQAASGAIHPLFSKIEALATAGRLPNVIRWDDVPEACRRIFHAGIPGEPGSIHAHGAVAGHGWAPPAEATVAVRGAPTLVVGPLTYPWFSFEWCKERGQEFVRALAAAEEQTRLRIEYDNRVWQERNAPPPSDQQKLANLEREVAEMKKAIAAK